MNRPADILSDKITPRVDGMRQARIDFAAGFYSADDAAEALYSEIAERAVFVRKYASEYDLLEISETYAELALKDLDQ